MAGPYMKSGESIILTTDRVMIDDIEYDLILTSQRLALVDSGHTSEEPQVVPFATILSVKGDAHRRASRSSPLRSSTRSALRTQEPLI